MALRELGLEALDIEAADAALALVDAAEEPDFAVVSEEIDAFVILRFVDEIAVAVLELPDRAFVLKPADFILQLGELVAQQAQFGGVVKRFGSQLISPDAGGSDPNCHPGLDPGSTFFRCL